MMLDVFSDRSIHPITQKQTKITNHNPITKYFYSAKCHAGKILYRFTNFKKNAPNLQGVIESCTDILTTSYWLHVELGKNI
jgi:hypothetical protein